MRVSGILASVEEYERGRSKEERGIDFSNALNFLVIKDDGEKTRFYSLVRARPPLYRDLSKTKKSIDTKRAKQDAIKLGAYELVEAAEIQAIFWDCCIRELKELGRTSFSQHNDRSRKSSDHTYYIFDCSNDASNSPEVAAERLSFEGAITQVSRNFRERNPNLRQELIDRKLSDNGRLACCVCDMDFQTIYGDFGSNYIHVHHLHPLSLGIRETNGLIDLVSVCPNCHAMLHIGRTLDEGPRTPEELRIIMKARKAI